MLFVYKKSEEHRGDFSSHNHKRNKRFSSSLLKQAVEVCTVSLFDFPSPLCLFYFPKEGERKEGKRQKKNHKETDRN